MTKPQRSNKQNLRMQLVIHMAMTGRSTTPGTLLPSPSDSITQTWSRSAAASSYFWGFPVQRAELSTPALLSPPSLPGVMAPLQDGLILSTYDSRELALLPAAQYVLPFSFSGLSTLQCCWGAGGQCTLPWCSACFHQCLVNAKLQLSLPLL